jgi:pyrimidine-specific ribonucleoside hydrolase
MKTPILFDMETSDPDDAMTLALLSFHPCAELKAVTVTPGSKAQIGVVKEILKRCGVSVPVGSRKPDHPKDSVSSWHYDVLGAIPPAEPDALGHEVIANTLKSRSGTLVLTGGPVGNLREFLENHPDISIGTWVAQGGFAGDNVVPEEHRLSKFAGMITCPTFNFNGDRKGALLALSSPKIVYRELVSKNVCHGVAYGRADLEQLKANPRPEPGWKVLCDLIEGYTKGGSEKKMHDPLAACVAMYRPVCDFRKVEVYYEKGMWGSRLTDQGNTQISISVRKEVFREMMSGICPSCKNKGVVPVLQGMVPCPCC